MAFTTNKHDTRNGLTILMLMLVLLAGSASAEIIKHLEFDVDGSLPSDDPQIAVTADDVSFGELKALFR